MFVYINNLFKNVYFKFIINLFIFYYMKKFGSPPNLFLITLKYDVFYNRIVLFSMFVLIFYYFRSAFFWFCNDERGQVKANNPDYGVGDIAKELGRKWADAEPHVKQKYEAMAEKDKARYERVNIISFKNNIPDLIK